MTIAGIMCASRMQLHRVTTLGDGIGLTQKFVGNKFE